MTKWSVQRPLGVLSAVILTLGLATACSSGSSPKSTSSVGNASASSGGSASTQTAGLADVSTLSQLYHGIGGTPPTSAPAPQKGASIYWISCGQQVADCANKAAAAKIAAAKLGFTLHLVDGNSGLGGAYLSATNTAVAASPSAIVEQSIPCDSVKVPLQRAKSAGIPVLAFDGLDCSDTSDGPALFTAPMIYNDVQNSLSAFWSAYGKQAADYVIRASGGHAQIIDNVGPLPQMVMLDKAFVSEMRKCSGCKIVDTIHFSLADFVPGGGWISNFRSALIKNPTATAAYLPFDVMATTFGGAQAIRVAGHKMCSGTPPFSNSCFIGFGGSGQEDLLGLIRNGEWTAATAAIDPRWEAWAALDEVNRALNHKPAVSEGVRMQVVDKDHGLPSSGTFTSSVDFEKAYLSAWHVTK